MNNPLGVSPSKGNQEVSICVHSATRHNIHMFVNRSAMFVEADFKSTFGFSYVLFVTVVTLYHVGNPNTSSAKNKCTVVSLCLF